MNTFSLGQRFQDFVLQLTLEQHGCKFSGPLTCSFFSIVNTVVLQNPQLVESLGAKTTDTEKQYIWRANYMIREFLLGRGSVMLIPALFKGQLYFLLRHATF